MSGIAGNVDLDVFDGTLAELRAFAHGPVPRFSATYVAQSFPLAARGAEAVPLGGDVSAWIELRNTGSESWNDRTRLALTEPRDRTSPLASPDWVSPRRPAAVSGTVAPGGTFRFRFTVHGARVGDFTEHFGVVQEGVAWFSDSGEGGPPDAQLQGIFRVAGADAGAAREDAGAAFAPADAGAGNEAGDAEARRSGAAVAEPGPDRGPAMDGGCSVAARKRSMPCHGLGVLLALGATALGTRRGRRSSPRRRSPPS